MRITKMSNLHLYETKKQQELNKLLEFFVLLKANSFLLENFNMIKVYILSEIKKRIKQIKRIRHIQDIINRIFPQDGELYAG